MKKFVVAIIALLYGFLGVNIPFAAADSWTKKNDFGGTARKNAIGFSIGTKGCIGTGNDGSLTKDFWKYDPGNDLWTQKADIGVTAREGAVGFSIGSKAYIGTGNDGSKIRDFWEYNPDTNIWTQMANFGGGRASWRSRLLHREQRLHRDRNRWCFNIFQRLLGV